MPIGLEITRRLSSGGTVRDPRDKREGNRAGGEVVAHPYSPRFGAAGDEAVVSAADSGRSERAVAFMKSAVLSIWELTSTFRRGAPIPTENRISLRELSRFCTHGQWDIAVSWSVVPIQTVVGRSAKQY